MGRVPDRNTPPEFIVRRSQFVVAFLLSAPSLLGAQSNAAEADRQALHLRIGAGHMTMTKGYRQAMTITPSVSEFEVRGPSPGVPFGAKSTSALQMVRRCSAAQRASVPGCLRVDAIEIYTTEDSVTHRVTLTLVPHTFIGPNAEGLYEVGAAQDVVADAEVVARRYGGRVAAAVPWPIPTRTPDDATPRIP
jgi:hypothetical protein